MRIKHQLWKVSNGWLLLPENVDGSHIVLDSSDAPRCVVFKSLEEFAKYTPKRERKSRKTKPLEVKPANNPNINYANQH
jgi:hypothetical protein